MAPNILANYKKTLKSYFRWQFLLSNVMPVHNTACRHCYIIRFAVGFSSSHLENVSSCFTSSITLDARSLIVHIFVAGPQPWQKAPWLHFKRISTADQIESNNITELDNGKMKPKGKTNETNEATSYLIDAAQQARLPKSPMNTKLNVWWRCQNVINSTRRAVAPGRAWAEYLHGIF